MLHVGTLLFGRVRHAAGHRRGRLDLAPPVPPHVITTERLTASRCGDSLSHQVVHLRTDDPLNRG
jgi:hypothetical protein